MKKYLFPSMIALSALSVSMSAAFYSVFGLSKLFAGASLQVIIMAGSLEFAKLVIASLLYQYWSELNKILRGYLLIATLVLITITSGGIYGYLSGAYQETSTESEFLDKQVAIIDAKRTRFIEGRDDYKVTVKELTTSLANPTQIQYVDRETGQLIITTSSRQRKLLENQLVEAKGNLNAVTDSIARLDIEILEQQIGNESARELGPLKYMAELTGKPMSTIVNWFMLLIIFVFDPLAIAMVVAANMAFSKIKQDKVIEEGKVIQEELSVEEIKRYDTDGDGKVSKKELDEGKIRDIVTEKMREQFSENKIRAIVTQQMKQHPTLRSWYNK